MINENIKATGELQIVLRDKNGNVKENRTVKNLVVSTGKAFIASRMVGVTDDIMSHMAVGTNNGAPNAGHTALLGEIGRAVLQVDEKWWGVPRIKYQTSEGEVHLFAYEVIPSGMEDISAYLQEGYKLKTDGRYIPTKEHLVMLYNAFGTRVGLSDNWEVHYDTQLKD